MAKQNDSSREFNSERHAGSSALARFGWMVAGSLTMLISWLTIVSSPAWTFGISDLCFWGGAILAVTLRYVDVARLGGRTAKGEPATQSTFRRYAVAVAVLASVAWPLAQSVHF